MQKTSLPTQVMDYEPVACKNCGGVLYTTIEYRLPALKPVYAPAYVFVVDTCLSEDELNASQGAISQALQMVPEYARVALVTFGTHVQVYELGFDVLNKSYVFQGSKEYTPQQVQSQLGIGPSPASRQPASPSRPGMQPQQLQDPIAFAARRFILPVSECEFTISAALEGLRKDAFPSVADHRPSRCTGTAIQVTLHCPWKQACSGLPHLNVT